MYADDTVLFVHAHSMDAVAAKHIETMSCVTWLQERCLQQLTLTYTLMEKILKMSVNINILG